MNHMSLLFGKACNTCHWFTSANCQTVTLMFKKTEKVLHSFINSAVKFPLQQARLRGNTAKKSEIKQIQNKPRDHLLGVIGPADTGSEFTLQLEDAQTGAPTPQVAWTINPAPYMAYGIMPQMGALVNMNPMDYGRNPIQFCTAQNVQVTATCPGYAPAAETVTVRAPTHPNCDTMEDRAAIVPEGQRLWLRFGRQGVVGIEMGFDCVANGCNGVVGAIQLIRSLRVAHETTGATRTLSTNGMFVLDNGAPPNDVIYLNRTVAVGNLLQISDSPAQELSNEIDRISIDEAFRTYFMFRSNAPGAIWVPLYLCSWGWQATAIRTGLGQWAIQNQNIAQPQVQPTAVWPQWDSNILQYNFH